MATPAGSDTALAALHSTLGNLNDLLKQLHSAVDSSTPSTPTPASSSKPTNPLLLLHTSATLLRAQTTKLSLLAINKPFTPSAITTTLSLYARILPSLVSAVQLLSPPQYPAQFHDATRCWVRQALTALEQLLEEVPKSEEDAPSISIGRDGREGKTLKNTGVVWEECDLLCKWAEQGVGSWADTEVQQFGDEMVGDSIEELETWIESAEHQDLSKNMEDLGIEDGSSSEADFNFFKDFPFKEEMRPLANQVTSELKLIKVIFPPLLKRRVRRFPKVNKDTKQEDLPTENVMKRLDKLVEYCKEISAEADETVEDLYTGSAEEFKASFKTLRAKALTLAVEASKTWNDGDDEMTSWVPKWVAKFKETIAIWEIEDNDRASNDTLTKF